MKISRRRFLLLLFYLITSFVLIQGFIYEILFWETNEIVLKKRENGTIIKIIQISDLHLNHIGFHHKWMVRKINKANPHLLFFTGDILDKKENLPLMEDFLSLFNKKIKKFAILGNWEHFIKIDFNILRKSYQKFNCQLLINESVTEEIKGKKITITGLNDDLGNRANFSLAVKNKEISKNHIVLQHRPAYRDQLEKILKNDNPKNIGVDIMMAGHTHGGQISLLGYIPYLPKGTGQYIKGYFDNLYPKLYVNKGLGTVFIPFRLGARAEIAMLDYII